MVYVFVAELRAAQPHGVQVANNGMHQVLAVLLGFKVIACYHHDKLHEHRHCAHATEEVKTEGNL